MNNAMVHRTLSALCRAVLIGLLCMGSLLAAELTATVDRTQLALDETLRLTVSIDDRSVSEEPDFSELKEDFELLNTTRSTQLRIVNGRSESWTRWELLLAPRRQGILTIPPFELAGARSQPVTVEVGEAAPADARGQPEHYVELEVDKESVYPQEQLLVRIRLLSAVTLGDLRGSPLTIDGAEVVLLGDQQYQKTQGGIPYQVFQMDYAVFPRQAGTLTIPPQRFTAVKNPSRSLFDRGRGQTIRMVTQPREVTVKPHPANQSGTLWLPASSVELSQQLSDPGYRVGEPLTRTLTLRVSGQPAALLPPLPQGDIEGVKVYPEPAQNETREHRDGVEGVRILRLGLVPTRPGKLELPAVEVPWWDTVADRARVARIPAQVIQVQPAAGAPVATPPPPLPPTPAAEPAPVALESQGPNWLLWSNLAWAALVALLLLLGWRHRRSPPSAQPPAKAVSDNTGEREAHRQLVAACREGQAGDIRAALLAWARWQLPPGEREGTLTLEGVARRWPELQAPVAGLDQALFRPGEPGAVDTDGLLAAVERIRERSPAGAKEEAAVLPPLYG